MQWTRSFTSSNCGEINKTGDICGQTSNLGQMINTSSGGGLNLIVVIMSSLKTSCTGMLEIRILSLAFPRYLCSRTLDGALSTTTKRVQAKASTVLTTSQM